jgi:L-asparaginase
MRWCGAALAVAASHYPGRPAEAQPVRPRVHIVATGGTIASTNYRSERSHHVGVEELVRAVPAIDSVAIVTTQQFMNVASSQITPKHWLDLSRAIADTLRANPPQRLSGIVVTHGTDSMEETAYFLDLTILDARPVVVTGAMRPADGVGIDGPANLLNSVRVATDSAARGRGTMVLLNDEIFAARDATKSNTVRPDAFTAPYRGALGVADPERIVFHQLPARPPLFDISSVRELPRVDVAYAYGGADGAAVDAFVAAGAKGIVVASLGRGGIPPAMRDAVNRAADKGVVVVAASRAGSGSVPVGLGVRRGSSAPGTVGSGDLTAQKARILLMLALTRVTTATEVAAIFRAHQ